MIGGPEIRKTKMKWLQEAEVFSIPPYGGIDNVAGNYEWAALAQSKVSFLIHCPSNAEFITRCHKMGVRCFPYVTFSFGFPEVFIVLDNVPLVSYPPASVTPSSPTPADQGLSLYQGINAWFHFLGYK